ncbi:hypothetical protein [Corynebacterium xerosis]|uniref:hypothetical protein n=1 Tax=Corynebacterium xerosis TaxID=1725 RepID=UPI00387A59D2
MGIGPIVHGGLEEVAGRTRQTIADGGDAIRVTALNPAAMSEMAGVEGIGDIMAESAAMMTAIIDSLK